MAEETGKGSIFLKFIILILIVVLVGALIIPKRMWDTEENNTNTCRQRMASLLNAELLFHKHNDATYSPSLDSLLAFLKDSLTAYELEFVDLDTVLNVQLMELLKKDSLVQASIDTITLDTTFSDVMKTISIDYFLSRAMVGVIQKYNSKMASIINPVLQENIEDKMAATLAIEKLAEVRSSYDIMKVLYQDDSLKAAIKQIEPTLSMVHFLPTVRRYDYVAERVDSFYSCFLDSLYSCPTVNKPYHIEIAGSTIVFSNIYCPVDSADSMAVVNDWWKKNIGGLTVKNHGNISKGELSWEKTF